MNTFGIILAFAILAAAIFFAVTGNMPVAIFIAILWVGLTNNWSNSESRK